MMSDEGRARVIVDVQQGIFAKTMADIPLFFCLKKNILVPEDFDYFVQYQIAHTVPGMFYGKTYQYLFLNEW